MVIPALNRTRITQHGYALVTVVVISFILLGILIITLQYIATIASSSRNITHSIAANNAALNGIIAASVCSQHDLRSFYHHDSITTTSACVRNGAATPTLSTLGPLLHRYTASTSNQWGMSYKTYFTSVGEVRQNLFSRHNTLKAAVSSSPVIKKPRSSTIANSNSHACVVATGKVYCWGRNDFGQLGNGVRASSSSYHEPVEVDMTSTNSSLRGKVVTDIAVGNNFSCALAANEIHCWGDNSLKQLGNGADDSISVSTVPRRMDTLATKNPIQQGRITQLTTGGSRTCVVASAKAYCWGRISQYEASYAMSEKDLESPIYNRETFTTAFPVRLGSTSSGELKNKPISQVALSHRGACALSEGDIYCWGLFPAAHTFLATGSDRRIIEWRPHDATIRNAPRKYHYNKYATLIAVGTSHACVIELSKYRNSGIECFGGNGAGQLGGGQRTKNMNDYFETIHQDASDPSTNPYYFLGDAYNTDRPRVMLYPTYHYEFGYTDKSPRTIKPVIGGDLRQLDAAGDSRAGNHTCSIHLRGTIRCWGDNAVGQAGSGTQGINETVDRPSTVKLNNDGPSLAEQVAVSSASSCATAYNGLYCWGDYTKDSSMNSPNENSNLISSNGTSYRGGTVTPVKIDLSRFGVQPKDLQDHSKQLHGNCMVGASGSIHCWSATFNGNAHGQLGDGTTTDRRTPVAIHSKKNKDSIIKGKSFTQVATGESHACGLSGGRVYCWGNGTDGQLGNGVNKSINSTPVEVMMSGGSELPEGLTTYLASGKNTTCAIANKNLYCWGHNSHNIISKNIGSKVSYPVKVDINNAASSLRGKTVVQVAIGDGHMCALANDNTLHCWGRNSNGELGIGSTTSSDYPKQVPTQDSSSPLFEKDIRWITAGSNHTCVVGNDTIWKPEAFTDSGPTLHNKVVCWGKNDKGQLGTEDNITKRQPTQVELPEARGKLWKDAFFADDIAAAGDTTCGILRYDRPRGLGVMCWGDNNHKQIPNESAKNKLSVNYPIEAFASSTTLHKADSISLHHKGGCASGPGYSPLVCWGYATGFTGKKGDTPKLSDSYSHTAILQAAAPDYRETIIY